LKRKTVPAQPVIFSKQRIMQIKLFTIPLGDSGSALAEMNTLLREKVLT